MVRAADSSDHFPLQDGALHGSFEETIFNSPAAPHRQMTTRMMGGASQVHESVVMHGYGVPTLPSELPLGTGTAIFRRDHDAEIKCRWSWRLEDRLVQLHP